MTINRESVIEKLKDLKDKGYIVPSEDMIATNEEIQKIKDVARINTRVLNLIEKNIKPGITAKDLNTIAHDFIVYQGASPKLLGYQNHLTNEKYDKSISVSINSEVFLGKADQDKVLKNGDIVNICIPIENKGYSCEASRMFMIGNVKKEDKRLVKTSKECLDEAIKSIKPWGCVGDLVDSIEKHAKDNGYGLFYFIGHGVGLNTLEKLMFYLSGLDKNMILAPGMVLSIQPVLTQGKNDCCLSDNKLTYYTADGKLAARWTHSILVTEDGVEILAS